jgi:hypothetical protein
MGESKKQKMQKHYSQDSAVNKEKKGEKTNIAQLKQLRAHLIRIAKKPFSNI